MAIDEPVLSTQFAQGDPEAVRGIYRRYGGLVYSVAYKVLGDASLAEDATQQAFVQAWRAAHTYDPARSIDAWLATIARRVAIDVYRRERRHRDAEAIDDAEPALQSPPPSVDQLSDVWEVREALDTLPEQERRLVRLHHYGGLTHAEIASELDLPLGTVKSRIFRAHHRLAGVLGHLRSEDERGQRDG